MRLMENGDLSNDAPPRMVVVFNGLLGEIPEKKTAYAAVLRAARQWRRLAELYEFNRQAMDRLYYLAWRRMIRIDVAMVDHDLVVNAMAERFNRIGVAIANFYPVVDLKQLRDSLAYMPDVLYVVHGDPEMAYAFGLKGRLGLENL